jgi:hypothetical protein
MVDVLRKSPFDKFPAVYRNIYVQSVVCSIQSNMTDGGYLQLPSLSLLENWNDKKIITDQFILVWYIPNQIHSTCLHFLYQKESLIYKFLLLRKHFIQTSQKDYISRNAYVVCLVKPSRLTFRYWCSTVRNVFSNTSYQRSSQKLYIEGQTTQWPWENRSKRQTTINKAYT